MNNKVSLIIPIYNSQDFLERCLDSVCNQTYSNYEVILIDDGSTDNSTKICKNYCSKYKFVKYFKIKNAGVSNARNVGISKSSGNYITFVDADDYVDLDLISSLVDGIMKNNVDIVISNANDVDINDNLLGGLLLKKDIFLSKDESIKSLISNKNFTFTCWGNLYKSSIIKDNNISFDTNMRIAEDGKFVYTYLNFADKGSLVLKKHYYYYVINDKSTIHSGFTKKWWDEINWTFSLIEENNKNKKVKRLCERYFIKLVIRILWQYNDIDNKSKEKLIYYLKSNYNYVLFRKIGIKNKIKAFILLFNKGNRI